MSNRPHGPRRLRLVSAVRRESAVNAHDDLGRTHADADTPDQAPFGRVADPSSESQTTPEPVADTGAPIEVAPEVVRALGAGVVLRIRAEAARDLDEYRCCICEETANIADVRAALVVLRYANDILIARFAHPECSPSAVLSLLRERVDHSHRLRATCWLRPDTADDLPQAVLVLSHDVRAWPRARATNAIEGHDRALRLIGFTPLQDLEQTPPTLKELTLSLGPGDAIRLAHPHGVLYDGTASRPPSWHEAAVRDGQVTVLAGTALPEQHPSPPADTTRKGVQSLDAIGLSGDGRDGDRREDRDDAPGTDHPEHTGQHFRRELARAAGEGRILAATALIGLWQERDAPDPASGSSAGDAETGDQSWPSPASARRA